MKAYGREFISWIGNPQRYNSTSAGGKPGNHKTVTRRLNKKMRRAADKYALRIEVYQL